MIVVVVVVKLGIKSREVMKVIRILRVANSNSNNRLLGEF
jgi:hypothetical protein